MSNEMSELPHGTASAGTWPKWMCSASSTFRGNALWRTRSIALDADCADRVESRGDSSYLSHISISALFAGSEPSLSVIGIASVVIRTRIVVRAAVIIRQRRRAQRETADHNSWPPPATPAPDAAPAAPTDICDGAQCRCTYCSGVDHYWSGL